MSRQLTRQESSDFLIMKRLLVNADLALMIDKRQDLPIYFTQQAENAYLVDVIWDFAAEQQRFNNG
jgi:hypothetical protein